MVERVIIVLGLVVATLAISLIVRWRTRARLAAAEGQLLPVAVRSRLPADAPSVLYFYGPHCGSCRQQAAILNQLVEREPTAVITMDAVEHADLADAFGIATVPATVIVAPGGAAQRVNLGLRSLPVLIAQLREAAALRAA
jgi:thiol-disulfide isomerase/thioredoxin